MQLFTPPPHPALERLAAVDVDNLTPLAALNLLAELRQLVEREPPPGLAVVEGAGKKQAQRN